MNHHKPLSRLEKSVLIATCVMLSLCGVKVLDQNNKSSSSVGEPLELQALEGFSKSEAQQHQRNHQQFIQQNRLVYGYFAWLNKRFSSSTINITAHGNRLASKCSFIWPPNPKKKNIVLVGASRAFGYGVPDAMTIAYYMQSMLDLQQTDQYCVYNFAQPGYMPEQVFDLSTRIAMMSPPEWNLVYLDGVNEGENPFPDSIDLPIRRVFTGYLKSQSLLQHLFFKVNPQTAANYYSESQIFPATSGTEIENVDASYHRYCLINTALAAMAEYSGGHFLRVLEPNPSYPRQPRDYQYSPPSLRLSNSFYDRVRQGCNPQPFRLLDLSELKEAEGSSAYVDSGHYGSRMNRAIASTIVKTLFPPQ